MNKRKAYHAGLLIVILITWLASGWISLHWHNQWSLNDSVALNLSSQQQKILHNLPEPVVLEAFTRRYPRLQRSMLRAIEPVKAFVPQLTIKWINPDTHPLEVQKRGITKEGQVYISVGKQGRRLEVLSPIALAEALLSFTHSTQMMVGFTQSNGERALLSDTPGAWLRFYQHFKQSGESLAVLDTQSIPAIPDNIDLLFISDPKSLSTKAETLLTQYLNNGGDLIYTTDTQHRYIAKTLRQLLPLSLYSGSIVDANSQQFGFDNPEFLVIELLADHDISRSLKQSPLLAGAVGLNVGSSDKWKVSALLWSSENSWIESGPIAHTITMDNGELRGPIPVAVICSREINNKKQHIIILGDSDLWSDTYFNIGGNRQFAEQIFAYFRPQAVSVKINQQALSDQFITINDGWLMALAMVLLVGLPLGLIIVGFWWWRRPCI